MTSETTHTLKYLEVYEAIRSDILMKVYPNNTLLPTESQLMETYDVSRNTVRRALKQLQDEGFITTQRGSGSMVSLNTMAEGFRSGSANWRSAETQVEYYLPVEKIQVSPAVVDKIVAPPEATEAMGLEPHSEAYRIQCIWLLNGRAYNYGIQYINPVILPDFDIHMKKYEGRVQKTVREHYGYPILSAEEHITCCAAGFVEANLLNVEAGTPLLLTRRTGECSRGIFEYSLYYANPAYTGYKITIDFRGTPAGNAGILPATPA